LYLERSTANGVLERWHGTLHCNPNPEVFSVLGVLALLMHKDVHIPGRTACVHVFADCYIVPQKGATCHSRLFPTAEALYWQEDVYDTKNIPLVMQEPPLTLHVSDKHKAQACCSPNHLRHKGLALIANRVEVVSRDGYSSRLPLCPPIHGEHLRRRNSRWLCLRRRQGYQAKNLHHHHYFPPSTISLSQPMRGGNACIQITAA
jgi:hypothetical protein